MTREPSYPAPSVARDPRAVIRVAFQGELGAYSEEAAHRFFGEAGAVPVPCPGFAEVGEAVEEGAVDRGLLPIENTLAGSVVASYDVLAERALTIVGEVVIPIRHCVLGLPGATLEGLTRVRSHPVALAQCSRFLHSRTGLRADAVYDTAGAAKEVAALGDHSLGAIASRTAAARYGLDVLASGVEDRDDNQTRFLVVARAGEAVEGGAAEAGGSREMKTALLVETGNQPGALVRILQPFASRGINLSKIESRPTGEPWRYRFFVEVEGASGLPPVAEALGEARPAAYRFRLLGSYPRWNAGVDTTDLKLKVDSDRSNA